MFDPDSRYHDLETATLTAADGRAIPYKRLRVLPPSGSLPALGAVTVRQGERLDLIAARALGDPLRWWLIADANDAMRPDDLTATPGLPLTIPAPRL